MSCLLYLFDYWLHLSPTTLPPGRSSPDSSACSIMLQAMRSFMLPVILSHTQRDVDNKARVQREKGPVHPPICSI
eukprot:3826337-Prorocentrum_lima.AAC.1